MLLKALKSHKVFHVPAACLYQKCINYIFYICICFGYVTKGLENSSVYMCLCLPETGKAWIFWWFVTQKWSASFATEQRYAWMSQKFFIFPMYSDSFSNKTTITVETYIKKLKYLSIALRVHGKNLNICSRRSSKSQWEGKSRVFSLWSITLPSFL